MKHIFNDEIKKYVGKFEILENGIFSENEIIYSKMDCNGVYNLYGIKNKLTGELKLFKNTRSTTNYYYMGTKTYDKLWDLSFNDNRIYDLIENYTNHHFNNGVDCNGDYYETEYYVLTFDNDFNLKMGV